VEIVNIRLKTVGPSKKIKLDKFSQGGSNPKKGFLKKQELYFDGKKYTAVVYNRSTLAPGNMIYGPALAVDYESTTFLPPFYTLKVDSFLNLIIARKDSKNG
jgi:N-methylhydantoinase A/oxoprolinase/acetone carboxylase beta subunit